MNSPEITGTIVQIFPLQEGVSKAGRPWKSKAFLLETADRYPKRVAINLFGDHVDKFPVQVGYRVTAALEIESREFNGRWYTDVRAWNVLNGVQLAGTPAPGFAAAPAQPAAPAPGFASAPAQPAPPAAPAQPTTVAAPTAADDLPF